MSLDRLKEIAAIAYKDYATKEEVGRFFKNLLSAIQELRRDLTAKIDARLAELKDGYTPVKGKDYFDGKTPTPGELTALITPLIPPPVIPKDGHTPTSDELVSLITPLIPPPIPGSPDMAEDIRNKLELLTGEERLDASAIKGLPEFQKETTRVISGGLTRMKTDSLYTKYHGGASNIYVSATEPTNPELHDLWVDIS